jgi:flagellar basal body-associated protein FliL
MKSLLAPVIVALGIVGGGAGGFFVKSLVSPSAGTDEASDGAHTAKPEGKGAHASTDKAEKSGGHGDTDSKGKDEGHAKEKGGKKEAKGHGAEAKGGHGATGAGEKFYFKFSREFVVPIMTGDRVSELVILNISLETDASVSQTLFSQEPKLRDNIMTTLIALSNDGVTFESMTAVDNYETLRSTILMNLDAVVADGIDNVLILDLAKQEL